LGVWASGVNGKEGGCLALSNIVRPKDVES
jgi:hypothetical protein